MSEVRRGYKQTEVGVIPEDWSVDLLDSVAKRGSGHTPDKAHPEYWGGSIKWISLQDSHQLDRLYIRDTTAKITPAGIANSSARMHPRGTVVLSRDAGVGKSAIMEEDMAVSQHFMAWTCGAQLCNLFLYYWLQSQKPEFERIAMGNTIKTIGLPFFRKLRTPVPKRAEQEAIAEALSDADALIESLEQLLTKKRQIKHGAMQELLTGKTRLPGFQSKPGYKQTELGVIPEDWKITQLGQLVSSVEYGSSAKSSINGRVPVLRMGNIQAGRIDWTDLVFTDDPHETAKYLLDPWDVLFNRTNTIDLVGKTAIYKGERPAIFAGYLIRIKVDKTLLDSLFLNYVLNTEFSRKHSAKVLSVAVGQANINGQKLKTYPIPLPRTLPEQTAIATVLSDMDADIAALETKLTKARQVKQGMMQELLTGRTRLV